MITKFRYDPLKGHNSTNGDNPDLKNNKCQLIFDEESIYEISKLYLNKFCNGRTDGRPGGGGGGGVLQFLSAYVGSGPESTIHPKKYQKFQAPPKNIWNFSDPKNIPIQYLYLKEIT